MISAMFDDHYETFPVWREAGLSGLTCIHIDAHLDVMSEGFSEESLKGIAAARTRSDLSEYRGNPRLPWGGFHCGNYLYPALKDGTVKELFWVLPRHVIAGETFVDGVRQETQNWLDLSLDEYAGLRGSGGAVCGTLEGVPFTVCTADNLPELSNEQRENLAIDLDVDYFIRNTDDKVWQTPHELHSILGKLNPKVLTIAYSVDGGYTPLRERFLGRVALDLFTGRTPHWTEETEELLRLDEMEEGEDRTRALEDFLNRAPEWMKPVVLLRLGREREASALDPDYTERFQNVVARHLVKKEHERGLERMKELTEESSESHYLKAYLSVGNNDALNAKRSLTKLLEDVTLRELERSRVLVMKANACLDLGEAKQALDLAEEAMKIEPDSAQVHFIRANSLKGIGDLKKSAKAMRKALKLAHGKVSSLQMMLNAARVYDELGQTAMAQSIRRELKEVDVTGRYAIKTMLDAGKL